MAFAAKLIAFLAFLLASIWVVYSPGFDSVVAAIASLAAFLASLFIKKKETHPNQMQNVSGHAEGIQAGRDVHITKSGKD
ncbi:hypothetical protein [Candidatus Kuenenia sp.]|uniref:hypothetical protein n=1 Tax=Candidatus Kuenenia sp. TaxID=2499824 RepID=UPI0032203AC9